MTPQQFQKDRFKLLIDEEHHYSLGGFIKQARLILGYKRKDIVPYIYKTDQLLCQIEHDRHVSAMETYLALAAFYGIPQKVMYDKVTAEMERTGRLNPIRGSRKPYLRKEMVGVGKEKIGEQKSCKLDCYRVRTDDEIKTMPRYGIKVDL